jgi:flagellar protein FliS
LLNSPHQIYKQNSVQTATPAQLVILLYDAGVKFTRAGIDAIHSGQFDSANVNLKKAQSIIHELIASLNFDYEISKNLVALYEYFLHLLIQSNMKKDAQYAEEVLGHLEELREVWKQTMKISVAPAGSSAGR